MVGEDVEQVRRLIALLALLLLTSCGPSCQEACYEYCRKQPEAYYFTPKQTKFSCWVSCNEWGYDQDKWDCWRGEGPPW